MNGPLNRLKSFGFRITGTIWYKCDDDYYDCATCGATGTPRCSEYCKPFDSAHGACDQHGNLICDQGAVTKMFYLISGQTFVLDALDLCEADCH